MKLRIFGDFEGNVGIEISKGGDDRIYYLFNEPTLENALKSAAGRWIKKHGEKK